MYCSTCGSLVSPAGKFCSSCGERLDLNSAATIDGNTLRSEQETIAPSTTPRKPPSSPSSLRPPRTPSGSSGTISSSDAIGGGRFAPGQIIAERYRIVAMAGRGGMGEVYRAEDLKLGQLVAIKFLPQSLSQDAAALARFHSEVRIARQVSHPNVCRVFDIGDADGIPYLSMEYVDGEDLASLVRRIGRLSPDKAIETARQICAGLAVAHERGVIHRDLKPANVMLDGAGNVRITDFGLAGIAASMDGADVRAGTPAYMAPEQLAGKEVTVKSDIYSLGLILYEILTGKRAFEAATLPELLKKREEGKLTNPSSLVRDLDPLIEKVILRCLEYDPARRPNSALQVAAALPGGDPLAAALAAGETPSPQMVAASGETAGLSPRAALLCLGAVLFGMGLLASLGVIESPFRRLSTPNAPEVLLQKARELLATLGYTDAPADHAVGFAYDVDFLNYAETNDRPNALWDRILVERPVPLYFWYRQSPAKMFADGFTDAAFTPAVVNYDDPPPILSGMVNLQLDPQGRLTLFQAIPPQKQDHPQPARIPDWTPLFMAAAIDLSTLRPAEPRWATLAATDVRAAWEGVWPGTSRPLHVEAGAWQGKPVFFSLTGPWTQAGRMAPPPPSTAQKASYAIGVSVALGVLFASITLAYRNYRKGRGDRHGAWRIATAVFIVALALFFLRSHLSLVTDTFIVFLIAIATSLLVGSAMWMVYLALEPYIRRHWPQTIVSWTRVLEGRFRDPLVGRDILYGVVLGITWALLLRTESWLGVRAGDQPPFGDSNYLMGVRSALAIWLGDVIGAIRTTLLFSLILVLLRVLVRNRWLAAALFVVLFALPKSLGSGHLASNLIVLVLVYGIASVSVVRFGVIVLAVGVLTANTLLSLVYSPDFSNWYAMNSLFVFLSFLAIALWGFRISLGGRRLFKEDLFG